MARLTGAQRVAQANAQATSGAVGGAVTSSNSGSTYYKDRPDYVVGSDSTDRFGATNQVGPVTNLVGQVDKATTPIDPNTQVDPNAQAPQELVNQANQAQNLVNTIAQQKGVTLQKTPTGGYTAVPDLKSQYQKALTTATKSGIEPPASQGAGLAGAGRFMGAITPPTEPQSIMTGAEELDPQISNYLTEYDDFLSPKVQRTSLIDEYKNLSKNLGLEEINSELIDAKRVIEGTEDDIRNEIMASGGLATDSQVMALANARNKSLIKNYNHLLDTRNAINTQLSTLMDLSVQDRQFAEAEFDRKMNFAFKVAEFKQRAVDNSRSSLNSFITTVNGMGGNGYEAIYNSTGGSAQAISQIEKVLGLPTGGLLQGANQQNLDAQKQKLEIQKLQGEVLGGVGEAITPGAKPVGKADYVSSGYATRALESAKTIDRLGSKFAEPTALGGTTIFGIGIPGVLKSNDRKSYEQAQRNFVTAVLRKESGANIPNDEMESAIKQYFPSPGDNDSVILQKAVNRTDSINALIGAAGKAYGGVYVNRPFLTQDGIVISDY